MNIGYIVSSNVNYVDKVVPKLLQSLLNSGVPSEDVIVFVGGGNFGYNKFRSGVSHRHVDADAFDFNAFLGLIDLDTKDFGKKFDKVFLLHDTCEVGPKFYELTVDNIDLEADMTVVGQPGFNTAWCGFGMYNTNVIFECKEHLERFRNIIKFTHPVDGGSIARSCTGGPYEIPGVVLPYKVSYYPNTEEPEILDHTSVYGGARRRVEYFRGIDLYKNKANFGDSTTPVNIP